MRSPLPLLLLLLFVGTCVRAQKAVGKSITVADMQRWNQITDEQVGPEGKFVVYTLTKDLGDPEAVVYDAVKKQEHRFPRLHDARLSYDGNYVIGLLKPGYETVKSLKLKDGKKAGDKLKQMDSLLVFDCRNATTVITPKVYGFKTGERWGSRYAYTTHSSLPDSLRKGMDKDAHRLLVRTFSNQDSFYLEGVKDYQLARDKPVVVAHQVAKDSTWKAGIHRLSPNRLAWQRLSDGAGDYAGLAVSNDGKQVAFLTKEEDTKETQPPYQLHYWRSGDPVATAAAASPTDWLSEGYRVSDDRQLRFNENGDYLYFGTTPRRPERDTNLLDTEIADVEVWTTQDARLYTEQNVRLKRDEKQTYLAVFRTKNRTLLQVATPDRPYDVLPEDGDGHYALVYDDRPFVRSSTWSADPSRRNSTVVDLRTGKRIPMLNGEITPARWLQGGKHLIWYNPTDTTWNSFDPAEARHWVVADKSIGVFYDELNDRPMHPRANGYGGTLTGGEQFLLYGPRGIWLVDASRKKKTTFLVGSGEGDQRNVRYRVANSRPHERFIDPEKPLLLNTLNEQTKQGGYGWLDLNMTTFKPVAEGDYRYNNFLQTRKSNHLLYTRESFREFPDLRLAERATAEGSVISNANPQQAEYRWGNGQLFQWYVPTGELATGMIFRPDGFDPAKQYPLIVNFYERSSDRLNRHQIPVPGRSTINYPHYLSKGYVILNVDVFYREGYPGESAYNYVTSAVTKLLDEGSIDPARVGIQGHSWGGYQAAYIATRTNMFAAIEAGAPVVNMFSAYGGIRWGSGRSRQFQYEQTQSRIGGTPWSHFQRYVENSPLFTTDKINTPILILHNDQDGAVPWEQGIEWFTALRRLGKPAWLLNYRSEPHWPLKTANRFDFQTRMEAFFDHYLMGKAMPDWMASGVPAVRRGKEK